MTQCQPRLSICFIFSSSQLSCVLGILRCRWENWSSVHWSNPEKWLSEQVTAMAGMWIEAVSDSPNTATFSYTSPLIHSPEITFTVRHWCNRPTILQPKVCAACVFYETLSVPVALSRWKFTHLTRVGHAAQTPEGVGFLLEQASSGWLAA